MDTLTIEQALKLRAAIKANKANRYHVEVIGEILRGSYDRYKGDALKIAQEDVDFFNSERRKQLQIN